MKVLLAAALFSAASFAAFAAEPKPDVPAVAVTGETVADARVVASDAEVGQARRAYRAQCGRYESAAFCECVTAGVAQALSPSDVRLAARTIRERITAQGDAAASAETDPPINQGDAMSRIEQTEGHYADACAQFRH
jgi:hypothetical protein